MQHAVAFNRDTLKRYVNDFYLSRSAAADIIHSIYALGHIDLYILIKVIASGLDRSIVKALKYTMLCTIHKIFSLKIQAFLVFYNI